MGSSADLSSIAMQVKCSNQVEGVSSLNLEDPTLHLSIGDYKHPLREGLVL